MSQRSFNFYSLPASKSSLQSSSSNSCDRKDKGTSQKRETRPFDTSDGEPTSLKTNQGKISKFFAQKPSAQSSLPTQPHGSRCMNSINNSTNAKGVVTSAKRTRVVKMQRKDGKIVQDCEVYIGRSVNKGGWNLPHSKWGNPYPVSSCGGSAEVACQKYRDYILRRDDLLNDLDELDGKVLGCWCKVDASCHCHGDTLVELLEMKKKGELDDYVKKYIEKYPEPLYPLTPRGKKY